MTTVLVGHRGVGKSTLLERLAQYGFNVLDLDLYIEQREGHTIAEIFATSGEAYFRILEKKCFVEAMVMEPHFISMGAGFNFDLPKSIKVVWIKRTTDKMGRIFLNRPRLDLTLTPLEEYLRNFELRDKKFSKICDQIYVLPEGRFEPSESEKNILGGGGLNVGATLTVFPRVFESRDGINCYFERCRPWGVSFFELRNDFLSENNIALALKYIPNSQLLFSIRKKIESLPSGVSDFDWALELGECPFPNPRIYSLHTRSDELSFESTLRKLEQYQKGGTHIKLAVEIKSFSELVLGHKWQREDQSQRSFLPTSDDGRWLWYRVLQKGKQKLNFVNEGFSNVLDQPSMMDWLSAPVSESFAAVLGDPIEHSFSPEEHQEFFSKRKLPFVKIRVSESEWSEAIAVLESLGLKYAAVTSPLKKIALRPDTINTIYYNGKWQGANTDLDGLKEFFEVIKDESVAVWGGGGLLESINSFLPKAKYYSARTGKNRDGSTSEILPEVVVWAVGRGRLNKYPPKEWRPRLILDLNYTDDSPGKEYALQTGADYQDGNKMFKAQARAQRKFWQLCELPIKAELEGELL
ncbi:MAG: shikimate kinase [Pseudomonadota bacterium]|nr:shikimate kinase [Pseudomonadota bacterium]